MNAQIENSGNLEYPFAVVFDSEQDNETIVKVFAQFKDIEAAQEVVQVANSSNVFTQRCYELALEYGNVPHNPRHWYQMAGRIDPRYTPEYFD